MVLINSVLSNIPIDYFLLFYMPAAMIRHLDRLRRNFLWDSYDGMHKFLLVSGNRICKPKDWGGLGFLSLKTKNRALLSKWLWRFGSKERLYGGRSSVPSLGFRMVAGLQGLLMVCMVLGFGEES